MLPRSASLSCLASEIDRAVGFCLSVAWVWDAVNTKAGFDSEVKLMFGVKVNNVFGDVA